ncbi:MAG: hydantoinase/oxoprolinase family protein [Clostridia bacterium]|nr:hydantoinase/oxoprolinase family protein [Clostridia bacterium]MDD4047291.1 hydantoinase/oxoprolinase family protein [Clostridia bacterium]
MYIGIDIGGTFTDGVIISKDQIVASVKVPTYEDISNSIETALIEVLSGIEPNKIKQVTLSTTLITNIIAQDKLKKAGLLLIPGPGANPNNFKFPCEYKILSGAVDYRGRVIEDLDMAEVKDACKYFAAQNINCLAVACKFSQRNGSLEEKIVTFIKNNYPEIKVLASNEVSGLLNWIRRANGAFYTITTGEACNEFDKKIKSTLNKVGLNCPVFVLKADSGTLPLEMSLRYPLETIFSGPSASTLGALACTEENITSVVVDIGGTTTDISLILKGKPLIAEKGAYINSFPVPVRALAVSSSALGGDTPILIDNGRIEFGERQGSALCLGGSTLTVTDILVYLGYSDIAASSDVKEEVENYAKQLGLEPKKFSYSILDLFINKIENKLEEMFRLWEEEPAYRIWQVLSSKKERPRSLICLGGPAKGLGEYWSNKKGWEVVIPSYAHVANAIGAALARTTIKFDFFADTERMSYTTSIGGLQGVLKEPLKNTEDAYRYALEIYNGIAQKWHVDKNISLETLYEEGFNVVRGWQTVGKIFQIGIQTEPGIRRFLKGEKAND